MEAGSEMQQPSRNSHSLSRAAAAGDGLDWLRSVLGETALRAQEDPLLGIGHGRQESPSYQRHPAGAREHFSKKSGRCWGRGEINNK